MNLDPARTRLAFELRHDSPLISCRVDPLGRHVFAGAQDSTILRWDLASRTKTVLRGPRSWVRALAFRADGPTLLSGDFTGTLAQWRLDAANPTPQRTLGAHRGWLRAIAVSPDGRLIATCGNDRLVKLWSGDTLESVRTFEGHESHVYNVAFHPSGRFLVSGDLRGVVRQWDVTRGTEVRRLDAAVLFHHDNTFRADHGGIRSMAFNHDGSLLACAGITDVTNAFAGIGRAAVALFDWQTGRRRQLLRPQTNFQGTAWGVAFHQSGHLLGVGGGSGGALWFWRDTQSASVHTVALPTNARDLSLTPDGRRAAIAFFDSRVRVYDLAV